MKNMATENLSTYVISYREIKKKRQDKLNKIYNHIDRHNVPLKANHTHSSKPWYMMTKGKTFEYISKKSGDCTITAFFKTKSESCIANNKISIHNITRKELIHGLIQQKEAKWYKRNPRPIERGKQDLFKKEFLDPWKKAHANALKDIHDFVNCVYNKGKIIGRYKKKNGFIEKPIISIKIKPSELKSLKQPAGNYDEHNLIGKRVSMIYKADEPNLICFKVFDHDGSLLRVMPAA